METESNSNNENIGYIEEKCCYLGSESSEGSAYGENEYCPLGNESYECSAYDEEYWQQNNIDNGSLDEGDLYRMAAIRDMIR